MSKESKETTVRYFRCVKYKQKCKARVKALPDATIIERSGVHNHPPEPRGAEVRKKGTERENVLQYNETKLSQHFTASHHKVPEYFSIFNRSGAVAETSYAASARAISSFPINRFSPRSDGSMTYLLLLGSRTTRPANGCGESNNAIFRTSPPPLRDSTNASLGRSAIADSPWTVEPFIEAPFRPDRSYSCQIACSKSCFRQRFGMETPPTRRSHGCLIRCSRSMPKSTSTRFGR